VNFITFMLGALTGAALAANAQTLAPVAPPRDWLGVGIVVLLGLVFVAIAGYILHIKRTPGLQLGEAELEKIADFIHQRQSAPPAAPADPLLYDGHQFPDQATLDKYKDCEAFIAKHKGGQT